MSAVEQSLASALLAALGDEELDRLAELLAPRLLKRGLGEQPDEWLDTRGAARYLGMTVQALHHTRASQAGIPAHQDVPGGKLYFRKSELDRWRAEGAK